MEDDNIKKLEEYFKNLKDVNIKEKETNKEKIYMLEILQDLLPDSKDYKVQYLLMDVKNVSFSISPLYASKNSSFQCKILT